MMKENFEQKYKFLKENNIDFERIEKLPSDASFRVYERLFMKDGSTKLLMDAPPIKEDLQAYIHVADWLRKKGFSAPEVYAENIKLGLAVIEDFGHDKFSNILSGKSELSDELDEELMYNKAVDVLVRLQALEMDKEEFPCINDEIYIEGACKFVTWYVPMFTGATIYEEQMEEYKSIWRNLLVYLKTLPECLTLKDYHVDNLMWLDDRLGIKKVGLLDFQDARIGCCAYDLVSILEDARIDVSKNISNKMISRYLEQTKINRKDFLAGYAILGAQRNLRIIGSFVRISAEDKNFVYLKYIPRIWKYLEECLRHPLLSPLKTWLDNIVPQYLRESKYYENIKTTMRN